jgi:microcin C transport system substrate-binding protein
MNRSAVILCSAIGLITGPATAQDYPSPDWVDSVSPLISTNASVGGEISMWAGEYPESLNYYLANNTFCGDLFFTLYESLLDTDPLTMDFEPGLAVRWQISPDKRSFTFWIDPLARWSDGQPVTAEDVAWTFNTVMNPTNMTGVHKISFERFQPPEILGSNVIRFTCTEVHWRNLISIGLFVILPKHVFEGLDFNKINFDFPVVSGQYRIEEDRQGVYLRLQRRADWWRYCRQRPRFSGNFDRITYRFYAEDENAFEAFKKGLLDVYPVGTARIWMTETKGEKFDNNWIAKQWVENHQPLGFQGFAMNMRREPYNDLRVRKALSHLLDRERLNSTIMYNQYVMHKSYYEDLYDNAHPCTNEVVAFNRQRARELLGEAGWSVNPASGLREKDGKPLVVHFLSRDQSSEKFLAIYAEDLRDAGIRLEIERKDWASWSKDMDSFNFDMTWAMWGGSSFKDPEGMWASKEAGRHSGSNITGFRNEAVDRLIEQQRAEFDLQKRNEVCRSIDGLVSSQCPYVLLWNLRATRLLYWNRFGMPAGVLSKFGTETSATGLWWYDEDAAADLRWAVQNGLPLPRRDPVVIFDKVHAPRPAKAEAFSLQQTGI